MRACVRVCVCGWTGGACVCVCVRVSMCVVYVRACLLVCVFMYVHECAYAYLPTIRLLDGVFVFFISPTSPSAEIEISVF